MTASIDLRVITETNVITDTDNRLDTCTVDAVFNDLRFIGSLVKPYINPLKKPVNSAFIKSRFGYTILPSIKYDPILTR